MIDLSEVRKISMLDERVLDRLQVLAREGEGGILDIGAYIGGSAIALASGHQGRRKHAVIEAGGSYPKHPYVPTDDIMTDLLGTAGTLRMRLRGAEVTYSAASQGRERPSFSTR